MEYQAPNLREIHIKNNQDINDLPRLLNEAEAGNSPIVLNVETFSKEQITRFLDLLYPLLKEINLSPLYPYPLFILTDKINKHDHFKIIHSLKNIPLHFTFKHDKKLTPRELNLMRNIYLYNRKIINLGPFERMEDLRNNFQPCKTFNEKLQELQYYELLLSKLGRY